MRRGVLAAVVVSVALAAEVVRSNLVQPPAADDTLSVAVAYASIMVALALMGFLTQPIAATTRGSTLAAAAAGAVIAVLTIGSYFVVHNLFLDVVSRQQVKVDGFAASHLPSMRISINVSLAVGAMVLTVVLSVVGTALGVLGAAVRRRIGSARA